MTHAPRPTRRELLGLLGAASVVAGCPWSLARALDAPTDRGARDRRLVLLYLDGGNDGLNTVVPVEDDRYRAARPRLALSGPTLPRLDELTALHPSLAPWTRLFDEGRLAVLRGVGLAAPDRSHFSARDTVHAGRRDDRTTGWVGRALDDAGAATLPGLALGAEEAPLVLKGARRDGLTLAGTDGLAVAASPSGGVADLSALASASAGDAASRDRRAMTGDVAHGRDATSPPLAARLAAVARDTYDLSAELAEMLARTPVGAGYPDDPLAERLALAARLVRADGGPRVQWTSVGGFDTHAVQAGTHAALLDRVARATTALLDDLATDGSDARTLVLVYSEFGRRVAENGSGGTDHGAAAPWFALGGDVRGGLHGPPPDLDDLLDGDVRPTVEPRAVFAEAAARWLGLDADALFGAAPSVGFLG